MKPLSDFIKRYAFVDSVTVTGNFSRISLTNKRAVRDCNFNFKSDNFNVDNIDHMFDGSINAIFSSELRINESVPITSANAAFRGCEKAKLPVVDIVNSNIEDCASMFEGCSSAVMSGAGIPLKAKKVYRMYSNARNAFFNEISVIPDNADYTEMFSGCENGVFPNLEFQGGDSDTYDCNNMFYYCGNMDSEFLHFDRVSPNLRKADYMFYSAGSNGSSMFDDKLMSFSKIETCEGMFQNSNFSFSNSFFRFDGYDDQLPYGKASTSIESMSGIFSNCRYCSGRSPTVILGYSNRGEINVENVDEILNHRLYGYYDGNLNRHVLDFKEMYAGSSFETLDLRGISNNGRLNEFGFGGQQDFTAMCKDCRSMTSVLGYVPVNASKCTSMFEGCTSLSADLSLIFREQTAKWSDMKDLPTAFHGNDMMSPYFMTDISSMFKDCGYIYSKSDDVDLVGLFSRMSLNASRNGSETPWESVKDAFPPMRVAPKNQIPGLIGVNYDIRGISYETGIVRYNSFEDEPFEVDGGDISEFGLYSEYAKSAFGRGYYRYGGTFQGNDSDKMFFIMYYPMRDENGRVIGFNRKNAPSNARLIPHGWNDYFNSDPNKGFWSIFDIDSVYAGMICDRKGKFIKYAFIGNYTRIYHEKRSGGYEVVTNYDMPVTYFDGSENLIASL